ncbi:MAG: Dabb family protein [Deltaproteobacteria bacterium]|nr:Dabb family protein [Deltaproteobacteria bacterium]
MLKHVVFMKFRKGVTEPEIEDLEKGLAALPGKIAEIRGYDFGRDVLHTERSYDFALVSVFDDLDSMKRYQVHPDHQLVVGKVKSLSESILAVDFNY